MEPRLIVSPIMGTARTQGFLLRTLRTQEICIHSAQVRALDKARVMSALKILAPIMGTWITQGFLSRYPQLLGPAKVVVVVATFDCVAFLGDLREHRGYVAIPPSSGPSSR